MSGIKIKVPKDTTSTVKVVVDGKVLFDNTPKTKSAPVQKLPDAQHWHQVRQEYNSWWNSKK